LQADPHPVGCFGIGLAELKCGSHANGRRHPDGMRRRQQLCLVKKKRRYKHVADKVDHVIQQCAVETRQHFFHADAPRQSTVDRIDQRGDRQPGEGQPPIAAHTGSHRQQQTNQAAGRE